MTTTGTKEWAKYNINFSKGCTNNCKYCYAKRMAARFGWKECWSEMENKEDMANKGFKKKDGVIMSPSSHDITEINIELAIKVFKHILEPGNELLIVSKPKKEFIVKICNEIQKWKKQVLFRFTIGTLNDKIREFWEPGAPTIKDRIESLKFTFNNGWRTSVSIEPYLDENITKLINKIEKYVTDTLWIGPMNKIHVPKELWTKQVSNLYSLDQRIRIKVMVDKLNNKKIRYKDHFLSDLV
ncbi:MAG: hypothetical protein ACTSR1_00530 [Candidatus Heimdallarchaeota archaeon]